MPARVPARLIRPLLWSTIGASVLVAALSVVGVLPGPGDRSPVPRSHAVVAVGTGPASVRSRAVLVLHDWDVRRARAWAAGDVDAVRALYVVGSAAGRADIALLRRYVGRGLAVRGMQRQVLRVRVDRVRDDRVRLTVTDRLASSYAVPLGGGTSVRLPAGPAGVHVLDLRRVDGSWRMAAVASGP